MYDLIIKKGEIIDGSGKSPYIADISIKDGYIKKICPNILDQGTNVIDANGYVVCPGFIDINSHSDFSLYSNPRAESKILQGITTEIVGQGGRTLGPINEKHLPDLKQYTSSYVQNREEENFWNWKTQAEYINLLAEKKIGVNIASLVGYGSIRVAVMGFEKRKPSAKEMGEMKSMLEEELSNGIHGLSLGLDNSPDSLATMEELVDMAKVVKEYNGICSIHMREEGNHLIESINEALEIAEKSGVKLQISHLKAAHPQNWGKVKEAISIINKAKQENMDVDYDVYPYTFYESVLSDVLPHWIRQFSPERIVSFLKQQDIRENVIKDMLDVNSKWGNPMLGSSWDRIRIVSPRKAGNKKYEGMSIEEISDVLNMKPQEAAVTLLLEEEGVVKITFSAMIETDLIDVMKQSMAMYCTDGLAVSPYGDYKEIKIHPRYYGSYPRVLGRYVREKKIIALEDAISKATLLPAIKMNIKDRGFLGTGYKADITIFNKDTIIDKATSKNPHQYPIGIKTVIVNGVVAVKDQEHTGELPGEIIIRN